MPTGGILGREEYLRAMKAGHFRVGPFPERYCVPGKPKGEDPFGPTTLTLSLGTRFVGLLPGTIIDLQQRRAQEYLSDPNCSFQKELEPGDKVAVLPKVSRGRSHHRLRERLEDAYGSRLKLVVTGFVNGETFQTVDFPLPLNGGTAYAGFVTNLTRNARFGMDVEKAPRSHTGDCHRLTLEIENSGPTAFVLTVGEQPIANLTVVPVIGAPAHSESTVRGQVGPTGIPASINQLLHSKESGNGAVLLPA